MKNTYEGIFDKSLAYLEVSIISSKADNNYLYKTSEYSNVTAHLLHHSVELFLKYLYCLKNNKLPNQIHNIKKLYSEYKKTYPDEKFNIHIPFSGETEYLGFNEIDLKKHKEYYSMPLELQLRYPIGKNEERYSPLTIYETNYLENFKKDILELRNTILNSTHKFD